MNRVEKESMNNSFDKNAKSNEGVEQDNKVSENKQEASQSKKIRAILFDILIYGLIFYACLYLIPTYVLQKTIVDGPSMEDTLHNGEHLLVEKISYHFDELKRFDIIVFYPYGRDNEEYYVKRIIGLPGETIQIKGSDIYINNEKLDEDFGKEPITLAGIAEEPLTLGDDEYFVMGDNREVSFDSRYEEVGPVSKENIGGRAILRIWPLNKFGLLDHKN